MIERHLMKLRARDEVDAEEEEAIRGTVAEVREYRSREVIVRSHRALETSNILLSGVACRQKDLSDGRRQITELHVDGDYTDLHSFTLKSLDHEVMALTDCTLAVIPHERLQEITRRFPHLTRVYWFATNLDAAIHREWALSLGRRNAAERMAHLFCELHVRLGLVGLVDGESYALALTQNDLAECLGLTSVHVNRTLMQLREDGMLEFRGGRVTIRDLPRLQALAEFDESYLYLERRPR
jgi:CRP-like cAMP-binding protein